MAKVIQLQLAKAQYGFCRTLRHVWELASPLQVDGGKELRYVVRCTRCGCERIDVMAYKGPHAGEFLGRHYRHPKGYLLKGMGNDRPSASQIRFSFFQQMMAKPTRARAIANKRIKSRKRVSA